MRIYGTENIHPCLLTDILCPDVVDIKNYGLKSAKGTLRGKGGDFHGYRSNTKRAARRRIKRAARRAGNNACKDID